MIMGLREAIDETIKYAARYQSMISRSELERRLISDKIYEKSEIDDELKKQRHNLELNKNKYQRQKLDKARLLVEKYWRDRKWVEMVAVTGSVAAGYPRKNDDIDLLVVTENNRLWLVRFWWWWETQIQNIPHRVYGKPEKKDMFCVNLWLERRSLQIPEVRNNLNTAMDLILMKPLLNRDSCYEEMVRVNSWAKKYVATGYKLIVKNIIRTRGKDEKRWWVNNLNQLAFWIQKWHMKNRINGEIVDKSRAFFHKS